MSLCGFDADVCSSALLIPAILGCGRTEPPLNPLSEFAEPALFAFVLVLRQAAIRSLLAASALIPMAQMKPSSSRPTAVVIFLWSLFAAASLQRSEEHTSELQSL